MTPKRYLIIYCDFCGFFERENTNTLKKNVCFFFSSLRLLLRYLKMFVVVTFRREGSCQELRDEAAQRCHISRQPNTGSDSYDTRFKSLS